MRQLLYRCINNESLSEVISFCKVLVAHGFEVSISCVGDAGITAVRKLPFEVIRK